MALALNTVVLGYFCGFIYGGVLTVGRKIMGKLNVYHDLNGSGKIMVSGFGMFMPFDKYEALRLERDALAMKFEKVTAAYKNLCGAIGDADDTEQGTKEHDDAIGKMFEVMREGWQHVND